MTDSNETPTQRKVITALFTLAFAAFVLYGAALFLAPLLHLIFINLWAGLVTIWSTIATFVSAIGSWLVSLF